LPIRAVWTKDDKASRNVCADFITISWTDEAGESRSDVAILDDISENGACIGLDCAIPVETKVSPRLSRGDTRERSSTADTEIGYFLGVEFDDGYRWSKEDFQPSYLLEVPVAEETESEGQARHADVTASHNEDNTT
jgi:hypothetical protein